MRSLITERHSSNVDDSCDDTPSHIRNFGTPPVTTDSCPSQAGYDPVHNFMNYVDDEWMTEFTDDQSELASAVSSDLRPNLFRNYIWKDYSWNTENWRDITWYEWINDGTYPWIFSYVHGWQWCNSDSVSDVYIYDSALNWVWTNSSFYPWFYSYSLSAWIVYTLDSYPREFYNYATAQYFTVGQGQRTEL